MSHLLTSVEQVLEATEDLRSLRNRLAELEAERREVEEKIQQRLAQIAGATGSDVSSNRTSEESTIPQRILAVMQREPDAVFTAMDFATRWHANSDRLINTYRAALSRLSRRGKINRVGFGRYVVKPRA